VGPYTHAAFRAAGNAGTGTGAAAVHAGTVRVPPLRLAARRCPSSTPGKPRQTEVSNHRAGTQLVHDEQPVFAHACALAHMQAARSFTAWWRWSGVGCWHVAEACGREVVGRGLSGRRGRWQRGGRESGCGRGRWPREATCTQRYRRARRPDTLDLRRGLAHDRVWDPAPPRPAIVRCWRSFPERHAAVRVADALVGYCFGLLESRRFALEKKNLPEANWDRNCKRQTQTIRRIHTPDHTRGMRPHMCAGRGRHRPFSGRPGARRKQNDQRSG
jgi:hypothetical protein